MKNRILYIVALLLLGISFRSQGQSKLRRSESFFGFHFDFHATEQDNNLGENFDLEILRSFLSKTNPDYVQIDSKGHPGYSSYPTRIGFSNNSFVNDPIRIWRDVTAEFDVPLYVHYSGLWDGKAIPENPEWARVNADGSKDLIKAAYFSEYSEKLLIPQIKEMVDWYNIDGVWIDGDCWSTAPDYSPSNVKSFQDKTGMDIVPKSAADAGYKAWLEHNRLAYRAYLKNYTDKLHAYRPDFQVASNWAYSSMMPEKVDVDLDFLSGDVSGQNGVYSAAFQARCLALQGKPWDLMAWGFVPLDFMGGIHSPKSLVQLQQEAAQVMAVGGGFQVYFQQNRDGAFRTLDTDAMVELSEFCRARQPFCQYSKTVPQIGLWYSLVGWKKQYDGVYGWSSDMEGINNLLLDGQYSTDILMDHHIREKMSDYPVIVVPEWSAFDPDIKKQLLSYVYDGGNIFVIGAKASAEFKDQLKVEFQGSDSIAQINIGDRELGGIAGIKTRWQPVLPLENTTEVGHVYAQCDYRYATNHPIATINSYGKGKIAALYLDMSQAYNTFRNPVYNNIVNKIIEKLNPKLQVQVEGSDNVHIVLGEKNENLLVHLINSAGPHFNKSVYAYSEVNSTPSLQVSIKLDERPKSIWLEPMHQKLKYEYKDNTVRLIIPPVEVHSIINVVR